MRTGGGRATNQRKVAAVAVPSPPRADLRRFKPELTPTWLGLATLLGGHNPPSSIAPFRAAYLGGGDGFTAAVAAAVHPEAQIWWWDPDVRAVEAARRLRDQAALSNLTVHERPALPCELGGEPVDLLVVDGIIDATADRQWYGLADAITTSLRPGGIVCFRYRTEAGWQEITPVQHLIRHLMVRDPRPPLEAVVGVRDTLRRLRDEGAGYVTERPTVAAWLDQVLALTPPQLVAQVADRDLHPVSHARVRNLVERLACEYVGSAAPSDLIEPAMSRKLAAIVHGAASAVVREALTDLALRRAHRCDVFRLGEAPLTAGTRHKHIASLRITSPGGLDPADRSLRSIARVATLRALAGGEVAVADLPGDPAEREATLRGLLATGLVHPVRPAPAEADGQALEACARLGTLTSRPPVTNTDRVVVSPVLGTAVPLSRLPSRERREQLGIR